MPWFNVEIETGLKAYVNILHLKDIKVQEDYLDKFEIDYNKIQTSGMFSDEIMTRKKFKHFNLYFPVVYSNIIT